MLLKPNSSLYRPTLNLVVQLDHRYPESRPAKAFARLSICQTNVCHVVANAPSYQLIKSNWDI